MTAAADSYPEVDVAAGMGWTAGIAIQAVIARLLEPNALACCALL